LRLPPLPSPPAIGDSVVLFGEPMPSRGYGKEKPAVIIAAVFGSNQAVRRVVAVEKRVAHGTSPCTDVRGAEPPSRAALSDNHVRDFL
jgi:hypothetical protein